MIKNSNHMNNVKVNAEYVHVPTGTRVRVVNTCVINKESVDEAGERTTIQENGVMFVTLENEGKNETPKVLSETEFQEVFVPRYLQAGMNVLMIAMGKVVGDTEVEDTDDKGIVRLKHAGELVRRSLQPNGTVIPVYIPAEAQGYVFTALEISAAAAKRRVVIDRMIKNAREFIDRIDEGGEMHASKRPIGEVADALERRLRRTLEEMSLL